MSHFLSSLSDPEKRRVEELVTALRTPVTRKSSSLSTLVDDIFLQEFESRLLVHHVFLGNPLFQDSFERAFIAASEEAGKAVVVAPPGQRFWDVKVDGRAISLKSSKAKSMRIDYLHISKLTEAAWIQDCRTAKKRRDETRKLFLNYRNEVDEIVQLRWFGSRQTYELVGMPCDLLAPIETLPIGEFEADGPTINIPIGQRPPDFTLKLDRSDAKVTLANISKSRCVIHASWKF